jgi:hypothetical protein
VALYEQADLLLVDGVVREMLGEPPTGEAQVSAEAVGEGGS